jgi:hypothetical protein
MSYERIKNLRPADFKRYCGVESETFRRMVEVVSKRLIKLWRKTGRPPKLSVEDHVLLALEYWREYRTLFNLATSWWLHQSNVCRIIRRVEDIRTWAGRELPHSLKGEMAATAYESRLPSGGRVNIRRHERPYPHAA